MAEISTCLSPVCGATAEGNVTKCPECGWAMRSSRNLRVRGGVLLACGLFLLGLMGWITWIMTPSLLYPGEEAGGMTFTGKPDQARMILWLFWAVITFGAVATVNGLYQLATGRKNRALVLVSLGLAAIIVVAAWLMTRALR
jgi:predicted nucleic acid-binding Zn ribbon protein